MRCAFCSLGLGLDMPHFEISFFSYKGSTVTKSEPERKKQSSKFYSDMF